VEGINSPRSHAGVRRLNQIHGHYAIPNDEFQYVLATTIVGPVRWIDQYGYEKEAKEIQDLYLGGNKRDAEAKVPLEWLEAGNLVGPASYVQERIAAFREAGVTSLQVSPASEDPAATIAQVKEWVS
jgi:hypothetical protein